MFTVALTFDQKLVLFLNVCVFLNNTMYLTKLKRVVHQINLNSTYRDLSLSRLVAISKSRLS